MRQRVQWAFACLTVVLGLAVILEAQLWVSSGTGLTTAGNVEIDGTLDAGGNVTLDADLDVGGDLTATGTAQITGVLSAGSGPTTITNATGQVLETAINDGSVLARVASNETISGGWTFSAPPTLTSNSSGVGAVVLGRSSDNLSGFFFNNNANSVNYASVGASATDSGTLRLAGVGAVSFPVNVPVSNTGRYNSAAAQPGFLVFPVSALAVTASSITMSAVEGYDTASNFASSAFTAPVTGIYELCVSMVYEANAAVEVQTRIVTTTRPYWFMSFIESGYTGGSAGCVHANMTAAHTAYVDVIVTGGDVDVLAGSAAGGGPFFSGRLVP